MSSAFNRTMRSLEGDSFGPLVRASIGVLVVLCIWISWAKLARTPVYVVSPSARVEVSNVAFPIEPAVAGRITRVEMSLGKRVHAGDVLLVIDSALERQRLDEHRLRVSALEDKLVRLREQMTLYEQVVEVQNRLTTAQAEGVRIRTEAAASAVTRAEGINDISRRLAEERLTSMLAHLQSENSTIEQRDLLAVARSEAQQAQLARELEARRAALQLSDVRRQIGELDGEAAVLRGSMRSLELEIERRTLVAPADGVLGDVMPLQVGAIVGPGRPIATLVPPQDLRVVATFAPSDSVGRIRPGQKAYFRFYGFPWTQYGVAEGRVRAIANEARDRFIRVELSVNASSAQRIPLQHGLTTSVEVQVDQASPWTLLLRSLGEAPATATQNGANGVPSSDAPGNTSANTPAAEGTP